jgi:hypothetical protein
MIGHDTYPRSFNVNRGPRISGSQPELLKETIASRVLAIGTVRP